MLPPRRTLALALAALTLGALTGAAALWQGSPAQEAVTAGFVRDARVVLRVENVGPNDLATDVEVRAARGDALFSDAWTTPAGGSRERALEGRISGRILVHGGFSWTRPTGTAQGQAMQAFDADECGRDEAVVVLFRVDSANGVAVSSSLSCRPA